MSRDADVRVLGLAEVFGEIKSALDIEVRDGMLRAAQIVAEEAASQHSYQNRTGDLQGATQAGAVSGNATDGEVSVDVVGDTEYGEHVEAKLPFLEPAADRSDARVDDELDAALERAAQRAGWS